MPIPPQVLQHLSANPDNARDLLRAGAVDILAQELHRNDDDASCRKRAIAALINLSFVAPAEPSLFDPALLSRYARAAPTPHPRRARTAPTPRPHRAHAAPAPRPRRARTAPTPRPHAPAGWRCSRSVPG